MVLGMIILDAALCILRDERIEMHARHLQRYYYPTFHALLSGSNAKEDETWTEPPFLFIVLLGHRHARSTIEGTMSNSNFHKAAKRVHHG